MRWKGVCESAAGVKARGKDIGWWRWRVAVTDLTGGVDDIALIFGAPVLDAL